MAQAVAEPTWAGDEDLPSAEYWADEIEHAIKNGRSITELLERALSEAYEAGKVAGKELAGVYDMILDRATAQVETPSENKSSTPLLLFSSVKSRFHFELTEDGAFMVTDTKVGEICQWHSFDDMMLSYLAAQKFTNSIINLSDEFDRENLDG